MWRDLVWGEGRLPPVCAGAGVVPREGQRAAPRSLGAAAGGCPAGTTGAGLTAFRGLGEESAEWDWAPVANGHRLLWEKSLQSSLSPASASGGDASPRGGSPSPEAHGQIPLSQGDREGGSPPAAAAPVPSGPGGQPHRRRSAPGTGACSRRNPGRPAPEPRCSTPLAQGPAGRVPPAPSLSQLRAALHLLGGGLLGPPSAARRYSQGAVWGPRLLPEFPGSCSWRPACRALPGGRETPLPAWKWGQPGCRPHHGSCFSVH